MALSWSAPAEDADSVTGYEILRAVGEGEMATLAADTASTATAYTDATATEAGETYAYHVKAVRGEDRSQASSQAQVQVPHDPVDLAPTGLTAALAEGGGVALSWSAPAEDADSVTGYEVLRAVGQGELASLAADTASTATSYTDATATAAGETYAYQVKAIRGEDRSQASGQAQIQVPHDPVDLAPTGLTALILTAIVVGENDSTQVGLTWSAPAEDADSVTGYEILRAVGEGELATLVDDTGSTANSYADATATEAGETYTYRVKAIRGEDRSQASGQAQVQLPHDAVDLAPSNLTAEKVDGGINLSWTAPAEDAAPNCTAAETPAGAPSGPSFSRGRPSWSTASRFWRSKIRSRPPPTSAMSNRPSSRAVSPRGDANPSSTLSAACASDGPRPRAMQFHTPHATNQPRPTSTGRGRSGVDSYAALGTDGCLNLGGHVRGDPVLPCRVVLQELVRGGEKVPVQLAEVALRLQLVGRAEVPLLEEGD